MSPGRDSSGRRHQGCVVHATGHWLEFRRPSIPWTMFTVMLPLYRERAVVSAGVEPRSHDFRTRPKLERPSVPQLAPLRLSGRFAPITRSIPFGAGEA